MNPVFNFLKTVKDKTNLSNMYKIKIHKNSNVCDPYI